jgi:hypothetical protein
MIDVIKRDARRDAADTGSGKHAMLCVRYALDAAASFAFRSASAFTGSASPASAAASDSQCAQRKRREVQVGDVRVPGLTGLHSKRACAGCELRRVREQMGQTRARTVVHSL